MYVCTYIHTWLSHRSGRLPKTYVKPEAAITGFEILMMGGVSPETCWAIKKHWNNKFYYTVASCWFFLWDLYYDARIHEYQGHYKCDLCLKLYYFFFTHRGYSELPTEGIMINFIGVLLVVFAGLVIYLVTEPRFKRQPLPEDEMLLTSGLE